MARDVGVTSVHGICVDDQNSNARFNDASTRYFAKRHTHERVADFARPRLLERFDRWAKFIAMNRKLV